MVKTGDYTLKLTPTVKHLLDLGDLLVDKVLPRVPICRQEQDTEKQPHSLIHPINFICQATQDFWALLCVFRTQTFAHKVATDRLQGQHVSILGFLLQETQISR